MHTSSALRSELVDVAPGRTPADKAIVNGKFFNVISSEIYSANIAILKDRIAAIGDIKRCIGAKTEVIEAKKLCLVPGLVDPHLHFYHACMNVENFVKASLKHGTTAIADGFYAQGIVGGIKAVRLMIEKFKSTPVKLLFMIPSHAYLQNRDLGITSTPNAVTAEQLMEMLDWPETLGIEEPPACSIIDKDGVYLKLFEAALRRGLIIHGHASNVSIPGLNAYVAAGAATDHESVNVEDAVEKARMGIKILMRQASGLFNIKELTKAITEYNIFPRAFSFCTDIASPNKLNEEGLIDECIRVAVRAGINPISAIQMGTINAAESCNQQLEIGSLAPGRIADVLFVKNLRDFHISHVMANDDFVVTDGDYVAPIGPSKYPDFAYGTIKLKASIKPDDFEIHTPKSKSTVRARVIVTFEETIVSEEKIVTLKAVNGIVSPDVENDILLLSMIERHGGSGSIGNAFVKGFKLKRGAIATSLNALCENIMVVGTNREDMALAANHIAAMSGGIVVGAENKILAQIELPLFGLMSDDPIDRFLEKFDKVYKETRNLGCEFISPYSTIEFIGANGEIGKVKIFEEGLIDAEKSKRIGVILD
jgi:adenine deaminase